MTQQTVDPFAEQEKLPSISFKDAPVGTWYEGEVVEAPKFAQSRDYDTNELLYWHPGGKQSTQPSDQPVMSVLTILEVNGERRGLWAKKWAKPGSMFSAIQEAQKAAGAQIAVGGRLAVGIVGIEPSDNPKFNDRKLYLARYTPSDPFAQQQQVNMTTGEVRPTPEQLVAQGLGGTPVQTQPAQPQYIQSGQPQAQQQAPYAPPQQAAYAQTAPQYAPPAQPAQPAQPAPQAPPPGQPSPEAIEAIRAWATQAGMDPIAAIKATYPAYQG